MTKPITGVALMSALSEHGDFPAHRHGVAIDPAMGGPPAVERSGGRAPPPGGTAPAHADPESHDAYPGRPRLRAGQRRPRAPMSVTGPAGAVHPPGRRPRDHGGPVGRLAPALPSRYPLAVLARNRRLWSIGGDPCQVAGSTSFSPARSSDRWGWSTPLLGPLERTSGGLRPTSANDFPQGASPGRRSAPEFLPHAAAFLSGGEGWCRPRPTICASARCSRRATRWTGGGCSDARPSTS